MLTHPKRIIGLFLLSFLCYGVFCGIFASEEGSTKVDPQTALKMLKEGNERFLAQSLENPRQRLDRALETATHGQRPFATILSCSDSRVPLEIIFDQGIGDLFVIRVAGNVSGESQIGSIEYGVAHAGTQLVVVLGHTQCGAIAAACTGGGREGSVEALMDMIQPAVERTEKTTGQSGFEIMEACCEENVRYQIEKLLKGSEALQEAVDSGELLVIGGIYNVETGKVQFFDQKTDDNQ